MYVVILEERVVEVPGELMRGLAEREAFESQRRALAHIEMPAASVILGNKKNSFTIIGLTI